MSEIIQKQFLQYSHTHHLFQKGDKILIAVSGGADSMFLVDLCLKTDLNFGMAHCNFQLRGEDAEEDERFVKTFAQEKNIPLHSIRFNTEKHAKEQKIAIEEAARNLRYKWFEKVRLENNYQYIATAHHKNDNAETLLFNLFRGTGIQGLHGILPKRNKIIRPILSFTKEEIYTYMAAHRLPFKEDKTNQESDYTRNFIRNEVIPLIEQRFPHFISNMGKNIQRFSEAEILYQKALLEERNQLVEEEGKEVFIPIYKLLKSYPASTIAYEIFKDYGFSFEQSEQILKLADSPSGKVVYSATHRLLKDRRWFIISPLEDKKNTFITIEKPIDGKTIDVQNVDLLFSLKEAGNYSIRSDSKIAALDFHQLEFPLTLRKWRSGDYFYPLGMNKKKKLSRFFIDQKLSLRQKEQVWVLASGLKIVWIVGLRIDHRFKISAKTKTVLEIIARPMED